MSPTHHWVDQHTPRDENVLPKNTKMSSSSELFARALISEVTDNPKTMNPVDMAAREKKLLKAQMAAAGKSKPVGTPGAGVGPPHVLSSFAYAITGDDNNMCVSASHHQHGTGDPSVRALHEALVESGGTATVSSPEQPLDIGQILHKRNPYAITIALCMSRRYPDVGHPHTVTRQTAFDFNELQDREYKYVSSTDAMGWRAGGGEIGGRMVIPSTEGLPLHGKHDTVMETIPHPDTVHLPILHMDCPNPERVDQVIHALASGDIFIPHMAVLPDALVVQGTPMPDLMVRWQCERNEDLPPDEWPNWCLEFMHNQLYEYFYNSKVGPLWMLRPFCITLAKSVRWKTVQHMNRYFAHAEQLIESWRERGTQHLDPQHSYMEGGASPEEVARPHGIYLLCTVHGVLIPTNYFAPNFEPPYTTKMTRSLLDTVLSKSRDKKRREWSSHVMPQIVSLGALFQAACGCTEPGVFVARK